MRVDQRVHPAIVLGEGAPATLAQGSAQPVYETPALRVTYALTGRSLTRMDTADAPALGPRLQAMRKERGLTLEGLARLSGVSRSMLSQIERGQTNPTLGTVWALSEALHTDISELIGADRGKRRARIDVASESYTPQIRSEDGLCVLKILSPADRVGSVEWYELHIRPGGVLRSEAHARGTMEHLTVLSGTLKVEAGAEVANVSPGATARYAVDIAHCITNCGSEDASALLVVLG